MFWVVCWCLWTSGQVINLVPKVFPDPPTSYSEIERVTSSKDFVAPEDGYFKFIALAKSGDGGDGDQWSGGTTVGGGSGGSGGIAVSVFSLSKNDVVSLSLAGNISISKGDETAWAYQGGNGTKGDAEGKYDGNPGTGGNAGSANGGNVANQNGSRGKDGTERWPGNDTPSQVGGYPVSNSYEGYVTTSGAGAWNTGNSSGGDGTAAYVVILRGNTNLTLSQQNALDITALSLATSRIAQEQTSILLH